MSIWDTIELEDEKKKKSTVWDTVALPEDTKPSEVARKDNFREKPNRDPINLNFKDPTESLKDPVDTFFGGKKPTAPTQPTPSVQEEMVMQYDGKMVPKSQAKNKYGALIYGGTLEASKPTFKTVSLDAIKSRIDGAKNIVDNITYNQKISANPMNTNIVRDLERDARRKEERSTARSEGEATKKEMGDFEKGFIERNPVIGEFYKASKQFVLRDLPGGLAGAVESQASGIDIPVMQEIADWAGSVSDSFMKSRIQNYQENAPEDLPSFTEGGYKDPRFYARGIGQVVPQFLTALGLAVVTKKPTVGLAYGYEQEVGQAYNDLIDRGVSNSDARLGANTYGVVATLLERVNFVKYADKLIGKSIENEIKQSWKVAVKESLAEGGIDMIKEGVTEGAQQFAQNVMTRFYDKNQDLFEGVIDSSVIGALGGAGYASIGLGQTFSQNKEGISESAKKVYSELRENISKARDIFRGKITPKTKEEEIIAERVVTQYENKVKETAIVIYDPEFGVNNPFQEVAVNTQNSPIVKIETVKYDDGQYSANTEVNVNGNVTVTPFEEVSKTKDEAIKKALDKIDTTEIKVQEVVQEIQKLKEDVKTERQMLEERKAQLETEQQERLKNETELSKEEFQKVKSEYGMIVDKLNPYIIKDKIEKAINEKDYESLAKSLGNLENTTSRKAFEDLTGIKLPKTQRDTIAKVKEFVGEEQFGKYIQKKQEEQKDMEEKLRDRKNARIEEEWRKKKIRLSSGDIITAYEYYSDILKDGWNWRKEGIGNVYFTKGDRMMKRREKGLIELLKHLDEKIDNTRPNQASKEELDHLFGQDKKKEDNIPTNPSQNENRSETVSDTRSVPTGTDRTSSENTSREEARGQGGSSTPQSRDGSQGEGTARVGKKTRSEINKQAIEILEKKKYSTNSSDYTEAEKLILRQYTGAGGKESEGATGRGLLDEYYTPTPIVKAMWEMVENTVSLVDNPLNVLEPTVGVGRFFESNPGGYELYGRELDKTSGTIAQILNPEAKIEIGDFQNLFMTNEGKKLKPEAKYSVVIGNPPYGERSGFLKGLGEESKINRQEEYFIKRGIDLLNEDGILAYIIPSSFLKNGTSKGKEAIIQAGGELIGAFRLPEGVFEDTSIGTDVVIFKKTGEGSLEDIVGDLYYEKNPSHILGTVETRKSRFGKMEEYVKGDRDEAMNRLVEESKKFVGDYQRKFRKEKTDTKQEKTDTKNEQPAVQKNAEPKTRVSKPRENKEVSVGNIKTIEYQVINDADTNDIELEIFRNTNADGSVPYREEWKPYLNKMGDKWYHDINYFSGDVREKHDILQGSSLYRDDPEQYKKQNEGLLKIFPQDKTIKDVTFDPLDRFIAEMETGETKGQWTRQGWKEEKVNILSLFQRYVREYNRNLIGHRVQKEDIINYVTGQRQRKDTKEITGYIKSESKRLFNQFIKGELPFELQEKIMLKYNREKNSYVRPKYDMIPVEIRGMASEFRGKEFMLSETQKNGVGFLVNKGSGLIAYGVGVGKTHTLMTATLANMQKGWTKRPLFIVPNATLDKTWIQTINSMFPGVKINNLEGLQAPVVARLKKQKGEDYTKWISDGEISIITHDGILRLGFTEDEMFDLTKDLQDALGTFDAGTQREAEKNKEKIKEELGKALKGSTDIYFSQLGFDHISVDEVHNFRKVFQGAKAEEKDGVQVKKRFSNVIGGTPSTRARKLFLISQAVQKKSGGRNVFLASATPFENHATEVYNILSFMARDRLKAMGIFNINDFFSTFANFQTEMVQNASGGWIDKEVMKSFSNLPELQRFIQEFIDFKEDPTLVRPEKIVMTPQLKMSPKQQEVRDKIYEMLKSEDDGVTLKASTYAKTNAVSPYFVTEFMDAPKDADEFVENSPKIKYTMEMIKALKENPKTKDKGSFIYIGKEGVGFTDMYVQYLKKHVGLKESEIGIITGEITDDKRESIKEKFNSGEIKVLIGGDPTKEGIDLQQNGYATFNIALGWNPTEMAQVEGRIWRQGNKASHVLMVYPLVENSGDINIYQKFEEKASRINDLFSYQSESGIFDVGELDPKEKKLMLLTDPTQKANLALTLDMQKLQSERLYAEGEKEDLIKMKNELNRERQNVKSYSEIVERYKGKEDSYSMSQVKTYKDELTKSKNKVSGIEKKLKEREIVDIDQEVAKIDSRVEVLKTEEEAMKQSLPDLIEKYQREYDENLKLTKSMDTHKNDLLKKVETLREKTDEELAEEKARLVKQYSGDAFIMDEVKKTNASKSVKDFKDHIEQLNKFAMARGIMRKIGGTGKEAGGKFYKKGVDGVTTLGEVRIREDVPLDDKTYMSVLSHELAHALEYHITGATNKDTYKVFGDITVEQQAQIKKELMAVTRKMEGAKADQNPSYYFRDTELLARFLQRFFEAPIDLAEMAPLASEMILKNSVNNPILSEYMEAVNGTIDSLQFKLPGFLEIGRSLMYDLRQRFQAVLGERAGNRAYNTIIKRNQLMARSRAVFGEELKKKFKGVKNIELLFRTIEATLMTKNGKPVFGTKDYMIVKNGRKQEYADSGWITDTNQEGVEEGTTRMWISRYSKTQGQEMYDQLNDVEKKIVIDFTSSKEEAVDFFNREIIKEKYKIENEVEGWIHRFWESDGGIGVSNLGDKEASARKKREGNKGYVEDMQKALYKAVVDLENEGVFNDWLREFIPTVSKPLAEGQYADRGWVAVEGDFITSFLLQGQRNDYMITDQGTFKVKKARYQIPEFVYKQFGKLADLSQEASTVYAMSDLIAKFWQVNILAHPGTASTNLIGGGLQYTLKIMDDMYKSILTGDPSYIKNDITALFDVIKKWNDVPDWLFGGESSTFYRDIGSKRYTGTLGKVHDAFDKGANIVLYPFQLFERYWKKVLAQSSGAFAVTHLNKLSKEGLPKLDMNDKEVLEMIDSMVDLYGFNYDNSPIWLQDISKHPAGKLTLPFKRYIFKYLKMLMNHVGGVFDMNQPWQDRTAKMLGLVTWMGVAMAIYNMGDDDRETPEEISEETPKWMSPQGKMFIGKDEEGLEKFVRIVKYPGFNLVEFGNAVGPLAKGDLGQAYENVTQGFADMTEGASSIGPLAQLIATQLGYRNKFQLYTETDQLHAKNLATFTPGYRVLNDISQILDPYKRKPESPIQEFTRLIPISDPALQEKFRGKIAVDRVPVSRDEQKGTRTTKDVPRRNYAEDTALSLMTGIFTTRIDPDAVKAFAQRDIENAQKKQEKAVKEEIKATMMDRYIEKYNSMEGFGKGTKIEKEIRQDLNPKTQAEKAEATKFIKEFRVMRDYSTNDDVKKIYNANTIEEKLDIFAEMKGSMDPAEYKKLKNELRQKEIISDQVWKELRKQDK